MGMSGLRTVRKACIPRVTRAYMSSGCFRAVFARGGTSNGLLIRRGDLPKDVKAWQPVLASVMGSPDSYGRQLDGMGQGSSSTSKIMVVEKSSRPDADVDYTFVQVGIGDGSLDMAGNCGNMSSAVGPFAWDRLLDKVGISKGQQTTTLRLFNTNTSKIIDSTFAIEPETGLYQPRGEYSIDGVPGRGSRVTLSFIDPGGAKTGKALPTGNPIDLLHLPGGTTIRASLTDIANPGVFVLASDLGVEGDITPNALQANQSVMSRLEEIRRTGASMMGLDPNVQSIPKVVMLSPSANSDTDIVCRALSMQQAHKAMPLTHALNVGVSVKMPGTLANELAGVDRENGSIVLAHASGSIEVGSVIRGGKVESAVLHRTSRMLMEGSVFYTLD